MSRKRSIEIYLKEGVEEDDTIFAVWQSLKGRRPQELFRRVLKYGLIGCIERGELPKVALAEIDTLTLQPVPLAKGLLYTKTSYKNNTSLESVDNKNTVFVGSKNKNTKSFTENKSKLEENNLTDDNVQDNTIDTSTDTNPLQDQKLTKDKNISLTENISYADDKSGLKKEQNTATNQTVVNREKTSNKPRLGRLM